MSTQLRLIAAAVATLAMGQVSAQTYANSGYGYGNNNGYGNTRAVRCESVNSRRTFCRVDTQGSVRISRQLSHRACIQGRNWSYDSRGIWVSNGCRAEFAISPRHGYRHDGSYDASYGDRSRYGRDGDRRYGNNDYRDSHSYDGERNDYSNDGYQNRSSQAVRCSVADDGRSVCRTETTGDMNYGDDNNSYDDSGYSSGYRQP